jgi:multidrug resistance protein
MGKLVAFLTSCFGFFVPFPGYHNTIAIMPTQFGERQPLLSSSEAGDQDGAQHQQQHHHQDAPKVEFQEHDPANPKEWPQSRKYAMVLQITTIAFILPMASSIFAPAMSDMTADLHTSSTLVKLQQTGFVCMLGIGPLFLAPMSETFGRRTIYLLNLALFTLVQIPIALAPNVATLVVFRTLSGFFGSVGVGNGGGSISDMFDPHERAKVLGVYMVAPLLAPTIGPLIGALLVDRVSWRWLAWLLMLLAGVTTGVTYVFLSETRAVTILERRKRAFEREHPRRDFSVPGSTTNQSSIPAKIAANSTRAIKILTTQPIVLILSVYQALIFSTMYSLYAQYTPIWSSLYGFDKTQIGLSYLAPALGFIITSAFIILLIDRVYTHYAKQNGTAGGGQPEHRLPMANIGAVVLPVSLFWFGWALEARAPWPVPLAAMLLFGASHVAIFNPVQTYYIDAYEAEAASALAAGAFLRSQMGGVVPLFVSGLFDRLGYGWGMSVFGGLAVVLMPAPALFFRYGRGLRERFPFEG